MTFEKDTGAGRSVRVLIVDDYEQWRSFVRLTLERSTTYHVIGEVSDGLEAVQRAQDLRPDLIVLDIGLPGLNGIEAAKRIHSYTPDSKILFLSENRSLDIAEAALHSGGSGYVHKSDAASELMLAVEAVLQSRRFVSGSLIGHGFIAPMKDNTSEVIHCHEVAFYADDASAVDGYARFVESALTIGHPVVVVVTDVHRPSLIAKLEASGVDVNAAIAHRSLALLDAAETLSKMTVDEMPDPVRCTRVIGDLIADAASLIQREQHRVVVCGEIAPILLSRGNAEGAIKLEHLWDEITRSYGVQTLCGYVEHAYLSKESPIFSRICAEHSAVRGLGF